MDRLSRAEFLQHLREALNRLHDPVFARQSPLATLLGVADRFDTFSALQEILFQAIEALEPGPDEPLHSPKWRMYEALHYRYVQQLSQKDVADQLGIGERQVRREQRAALEALADYLWDKYSLHARLEPEGADAEIAQKMAPLNTELAWLKGNPPATPVNLDKILSEVLDLTQSLIEHYEVRLRISTGASLPSLAAHPAALSQALISVLGVALHLASGGEVCLSATPLRWYVQLDIRATTGASAQCPLTPDDAANLEQARQLVELCGGSLTLSGEAGAFARLLLPALEQLVVLAIDDNADALQLLQRYTSGTRYRLIGTRELEEALSLAQQLSPQAIILDVMMPGMDGWKILRRLRQHPVTLRVPVVVCTILAQEELALSLGAAAFVRKPVTQQTLLAALDRLIVLPAKGTG
ncbi:MAG: response regulator [Anaerolineae bacterium]